MFKIFELCDLLDLYCPSIVVHYIYWYHADCGDIVLIIVIIKEHVYF